MFLLEAFTAPALVHADQHKNLGSAIQPTQPIPPI
jgi:hypothetical protein